MLSKTISFNLGRTIFQRTLRYPLCPTRRARSWKTWTRSDELSEVNQRHVTVSGYSELIFTHVHGPPLGANHARLFTQSHCSCYLGSVTYAGERRISCRLGALFYSRSIVSNSNTDFHTSNTPKI